MENPRFKQHRSLCSHFQCRSHIKICIITYHWCFNSAFTRNSNHSHLSGWAFTLPVYVLLCLYNQAIKISLSRRIQCEWEAKRFVTVAISYFYRMHGFQNSGSFSELKSCIWFGQESGKELAVAWPFGLFSLIFDESGPSCRFVHKIQCSNLVNNQESSISIAVTLLERFQ